MILLQKSFYDLKDYLKVSLDSLQLFEISQPVFSTTLKQSFYEKFYIQAHNFLACFLGLESITIIRELL